MSRKFLNSGQKNRKLGQGYSDRLFKNFVSSLFFMQAQFFIKKIFSYLKKKKIPTLSTF